MNVVMTSIRVFLARLRAWFGRANHDRDLADELEAHINLASDEYARRGLNPEDARRAALIDSGGIEVAKEEVRSQWALPLSETLGRDISFALRSFRRNPGLVATVVITLALSIGATTAMFSVVRGLLFAPLPFANGSRLVWTVNHGTRPYDAMSPADLADWARMNPAFEQVGSWLESSTNLVGGRTPVHLAAAEVTGNWFTMLGVRMSLGRGLVADDEGVGKPKVVVLSHTLWETQFGADTNAIGRTVHLDGTSYTVIGVARPDFAFPGDIDVWRPLVPDSTWSAIRGSRFFKGPVALVRRGFTFEQARAQARLVGAQLHQEYATAEMGLDYDLQPLRDHLVGDSRRIVFVLFGAVALLLTIACVNLASLMLVRSSAREAEFGVRLALGASASRIVGQLLVESLMLSGAGAASGLVIAQFAIHAVLSLQGSAFPLAGNVRLDWSVVAFAAIITLLASITFGLSPAVKSARVDIVDALKSGSRGAGTGRSASRGREVLVGLQVAMVVPLIIGAVLLARSFERLIHVNPGFNAEHVVRFDVALPRCGGVWSADTTCAGVVGSRYMDKASVSRFTDELTRRLRATPGTTNVAISFGAPFTPWASNQSGFSIEGEAPPAQPNVVEMKFVTPDYFATLAVPVLKGRAFDARDRLGTTAVVIVSENAVKAYFGGADPIGKRLKDMGEVIGVVGDTKTEGLSTTPEPAAYAPFDQWLLSYMTVLVRSTADPDAVMSGARTQLAAIDPSVPIFHAGRLQDALDASAAPARLAASVVLTFAAAALLLAAIGIYGVVSFVVRGRGREIAIRMALGAENGQMVRLVVREALMVVGVGLLIGLGVSLIVVRSLGGLLYGLPPTDPTTFALAMLILAVVATIAALLPGRRAASISPLIAMRPE